MSYIGMIDQQCVQYEKITSILPCSDTPKTKATLIPKLSYDLAAHVSRIALRACLFSLVDETKTTAKGMPSFGQTLLPVLSVIRFLGFM